MADRRRTRPARILMVEDDPADVRLTRASLEQSKVRNDVTVVGTGEAALAYLRGEGEHEGRPQPDLILLDINLPGLDGIEVLEQIKDEPGSVATIPVVMLTTSGEDADILSSYEHHAAAYVQKPLGIKGFAQVVKAIEQFWFEVVLLPPES